MEDHVGTHQFSFLERFDLQSELSRAKRHGLSVEAAGVSVVKTGPGAGRHHHGDNRYQTIQRQRSGREPRDGIGWDF